MSKKKFLFIIAIFTIFTCIFSLTSCKTATTKDTWFHYTNKSIFVQLDANYTTGYHWTVDIDGQCIQLEDANYTPDNAPDGMVGVGGTWRCTLNAVSDGNATLTFTYARPWDKTNIAETHILKVSVSNGKIHTIQETSSK